MFDSCVCVDLGDGPVTLLSSHTRKAHKAHRCDECRGVIRPGDKYEVDAFVWESEFDTSKICTTCSKIRGSLFKCGWIYGGMWEDIHEQYCGPEDGECVCPESRWHR